MADMIDTALAKELLGCDDTTLNGYINNGSIRAQRVGGKLMLNRDDVDALAQDEGTIVITSDSQDLQIDLEEPAQAIQAAAKSAPAKGDSQVISFGDELDVVSLDDAGTQPLGNKNNAAKKAAPASHVNTEMLTAVEEDAIAIDDSSHADSIVDDSSVTSRQSASSGVASARRSVRSSRIHTDVGTTGPLWPALMAATLLITIGLTVPTFLVAMAPTGTKDAVGNSMRGADDGFIASLASTFAGFSVEPDRERYSKLHGGAEGFTELPEGKWRYQDYLGAHKKAPAGKIQSLIIVEVPVDDNGVPLKAKSAGGDVYDVRAEKTTTAAGEITQYKVVTDASAK